MSHKNFTCVGTDKALAYIRCDLRTATKSLFLVGPWLDDYVAEKIVETAPQTLSARILVRPKSQMQPDVWERIMVALRLFAEHWTDCETRTLERLHAKCVCIDEQIAYVGSTNWYRYSLEQSFEVVLRGPMDAIEGLDTELEGLWEKGEKLKVPRGAAPPQSSPTKGIAREILDPIAAQKLRENPKAFVLGRKKRP
jgi:hypothetical protein